jgi:hypothetical protein
MKKLALAYLLAAAPFAPAAVINVEFKFAPFRGDPATSEQVTTVAGKAQVYVNNVPYGPEQEVPEQSAMVLFEEHEVSPAVWVPLGSAGSLVRKGKNKFRLEFTPNDSKKPYRAQLRWADVTDQPTDEIAGGSGRSTNEAGAGVDDRKSVTGKVIFEREFTADFARDLPWHHYPPVAEVTEEDKQKISVLLHARADWFQPDFASLYKAIEENDSLKVNDVRSSHCLENSYKAGVRVTAPASGDLAFTTSGGPEIVVSRKSGSLFGLDEKTFAPVKDEETQMCAGMVLATVYPARIGFVRKPDGSWEIVE